MNEVAFQAEVVVDIGVNRGEFLQGPHLPEAQHRPLSSSEWQVGILYRIVRPGGVMNHRQNRLLEVPKLFISPFYHEGSLTNNFVVRDAKFTSCASDLGWSNSAMTAMHKSDA